jgi:hypothetical protein
MNKKGRKAYLQKFPDGRDRENLPGIAYFLVAPQWMSYSDFKPAEPAVVEFKFGK